MSEMERICCKTKDLTELEQQKVGKKMLVKYHDLFAINEYDFGLAKEIKHKIELDDENQRKTHNVQGVWGSSRGRAQVVPFRFTEF